MTAERRGGHGGYSVSGCALCPQFFNGFADGVSCGTGDQDPHLHPEIDPCRGDAGTLRDADCLSEPAERIFADGEACRIAGGGLDGLSQGTAGERAAGVLADFGESGRGCLCLEYADRCGKRHAGDDGQRQSLSRCGDGGSRAGNRYDLRLDLGILQSIGQELQPGADFDTLLLDHKREGALLYGVGRYRL